MIPFWAAPRSAPSERFEAVGRVQTVYVASIYDKNDDAHPEAVFPRESRLRLGAAELDCLFQHESVTVLEFHKKN